MNEATRTAIAAAASSVEDIWCEPYYVEGTSPGTAHLQLDRIEYPNPFGGVCHWRLVVLLVAEDYAASEQYFEDKIPLLREAVQEHLVVTSVTRERLNIDGVGTIPCAVLNGHREED